MAIAKAVELELGNRKGQRTDLRPSKNFNEVKEKRTDEIAAKKAGFGNETTYRQATSIFMTVEMTAIMKLFWSDQCQIYCNKLV